MVSHEMLVAISRYLGGHKVSRHVIKLGFDGTYI